MHVLALWEEHYTYLRFKQLIGCFLIKLCFYTFCFSFPFVLVPYILYFMLCPFSILCFIHPHTLKDCEESVPAEDSRKSMDLSVCDCTCDFLCTVDSMSGHLFFWMLQLYLLIYFSTFCNWIPCKMSKLMRPKSSHYIVFNYSIPQLPIMLLGCTFYFLNLVSKIIETNCEIPCKFGSRGLCTFLCICCLLYCVCFLACPNFISLYHI